MMRGNRRGAAGGLTLGGRRAVDAIGRGGLVGVGPRHHSVVRVGHHVGGVTLLLLVGCAHVLRRRQVGGMRVRVGGREGLVEGAAGERQRRRGG